MKNLAFIFFISYVFLQLLFLGSCKKQIKRQVSGDKAESLGEVNSNFDIFSPVSENQARQFVGTCQNCDSDDSSDSLHASISFNDSKDFSELARQKEAKFSDIPIPFGAEPIEECFVSSKHMVMLGYKISIMHSEVVKFYMQEMECLGWQSDACFDGPETLMIFKKPSKVCTVSIREIKETSRALRKKSQKQSKIIIFVQV